VAPGGIASYTYSVKNAGTESDTYSLAVSAGWAASVTPSSLTLSAGQTASVTVSHTAPAAASAGTTDTGTLTVKSSSSGAAASASFATTVQPASPEVNLEVAIRISGTPRPGSIFPVTVVVTDDQGNPVPSAQVAIRLVTGGGRSYAATRTTGSSGTATAWFWARSSDYLPWTISAQATKNGVSGSAEIAYPSQ
jgi:hypothetical protein